jgi:type IV secretion system protein VirB3
MLPIRQITIRTILVLGADRDLVMGSGLITAALSGGTMELMPALVGLALWMGILSVLRLMAKADPLMRQVYFRNRRYRRYYPARSSPLRVNKRSY